MVVVDLVVLAGLAAFLVVVALLSVVEAGLPWLDADMLLVLADLFVLEAMLDVVVVDLLATGLAPGAEHFTYLPCASRQRSVVDVVVVLLGQATNLPLASRHCSALAVPAKAKHAAAAAAR